jgi:hypothetical protein
MSGVVNVKRVPTSAEAGIKEGLEYLVLEKSVVIITCCIGIRKVEATGKH